MTLADLPEYSVRRSVRARRVRLTVTVRDGLVVVVPTRWRGDTDAIVAGHARWAEKALARIADRRALVLAGADALLPDSVELRAFDETWPVEYSKTHVSGARARLDGGMIVVVGDIDDADACLAALGRWLDRVARERLPVILADVAREAGVSYASARVRHMRSRWGSCSNRSTISLNRALVFVPPRLVRSLMLHELAHTLVMGHSESFWSVLEKLDPVTRTYRHPLNDASRFVPPWAEF